MSELVGARIKEARTVAGMSQKKLADAVGILSASSISKIERGIREPTEDEIAALAAALGTNVGALLGDEGVDIVANDEEPETPAVADAVADLSAETDADAQEAEAPEVDTAQAEDPAVASLMDMLGSILSEAEADKAEEVPAAAATSNEGDDNPLAALLGKVAGSAGGVDNPLAAVLANVGGDNPLAAALANGGGDNPLAAVLAKVGSENPKAMVALMGMLANGGGNDPLASILGGAKSAADNPLASLVGGAGGGNTKDLASLLGTIAGMAGNAGK